MNIKPEYNNKVIYAFSGLGKTYLKENVQNIIETDKILSEIFGVTNSNLYNTLKELNTKSPEYTKLKFDSAEMMINMYKSFYTILTSNSKFLNISNEIFLPKYEDLEFYEERISNTKRENSYIKDLKNLQTEYKKVETYSKNNNKKITYIEKNKYLSDYLLL